MSSPYISGRAGRFQWMMQRVSAILLIFLAFSHFAIQHFTSDAVSTGLTVAQRMNDPFWQSYYVLFVLLALYHGANGLMGIAFDYAPTRLKRSILSLIVWTIATGLGVYGISNAISPMSVDEAKNHYIQNGFPAGITNGSPPFAPGIEYDARQELRELNLLAYYLEYHTNRTEENPATIAEVFGAETSIDAINKGEHDKAVGSSSRAFNSWLKKYAQVSGIPKDPNDRDRCYIFSSTAEFAIWAAHVRHKNAVLTDNKMAKGDLDRLVKASAFSAKLN